MLVIGKTLWTITTMRRYTRKDNCSMKKKLAAVALVLAMTAGLTACGSKAKVTLCEYKGIGLKSVSEADIETKIGSYVKNYFYERKEVEDAVQSGDTAYINYVGTRDGIAFEGGTDKSEAGTPLTIGSNSFIEGFEDGVIGMKKGETKTLHLTFPESYHNADLAGAAVEFEVTLKKNVRRFDYELNDETVKKFLDYETVERFREAVKHDLNYDSYTEQLADYLLENCTVKNTPKSEIESYANEVFEYASSEVKQYAQYYGATEEQILKLLLNFESYDALKEYCMQGAEQNVAYRYIIDEIAAREGIKVTDEVIAEKGPSYAEKFGYETIEDLIAFAGRDRVVEEIQRDMTHDFLIDNAKIF